nr:carbamoyltransferase HypF [Dehalococcoidia bacterium]
LKQIDAIEIELIKRQLQAELNSPLTSSMGRLFDAVSALIDVRGEIDYEGQAAVELEMIAYDDSGKVANDGYPYSMIEHNGMSIIQLKELLSAIVEDLHQGVPKATISAKFHNTVAQMVCEMCQLMAKSTKINQVALSGGVFQNRLLLRKVVALLEPAGFSVLTHKQVPCNDGGIALGQAVIASFASI